jgi:hypothetical protein
MADDCEGFILYYLRNVGKVSSVCQMCTDANVTVFLYSLPISFIKY